MKKKLMSLALAGVMIISSLAGFASKAAAAEPEYKLIFSTATAANAINHRAALHMKELVEEATDGAMTIEIYTDGTLFGGDRETIEAIQSGDCDLCIIATMPYVGFANKAAAFDIPFLFDPKESSDEMMQSVEDFLTSEAAKPVLDEISEQLKSVGVHVGGYANQGFRELTSAKEVRKLEDLKGLKIRTMENKYHMEAWTDLGANPTPMAFTEVFTGLEQGTIDGQENPYELICTSKFYEVQPYVVNTHHLPSVHFLSMSERKYQELPEDLQKVIDDVLAETARWYAAEAAVGVASRYQEIVDAGCTMVDLDEEEYARWREATASVTDSIKNDVGEEFIDSFLTAIQQ